MRPAKRRGVFKTRQRRLARQVLVVDRAIADQLENRIAPQHIVVIHLARFVIVFVSVPKGRPEASPGQARRRSRQASPWVMQRKHDRSRWPASMGAHVAETEPERGSFRSRHTAVVLGRANARPIAPASGNVTAAPHSRSFCRLSCGVLGRIDLTRLHRSSCGKPTRTHE